MSTSPDPQADAPPREMSISESTRLRLTFPQIASICGAIGAGVMSVCATYYGITGQIQQQRIETNTKLAEVNATLVDIQWRMKEGVTLAQFQAWVDDYRSANPKQTVPPLRRRE